MIILNMSHMWPHIDIEFEYFFKLNYHILLCIVLILVYYQFYLLCTNKDHYYILYTNKEILTACQLAKLVLI